MEITLSLYISDRNYLASLYFRIGIETTLPLCISDRGRDAH